MDHWLGGATRISRWLLVCFVFAASVAQVSMAADEKTDVIEQQRLTAITNELDRVLAAQKIAPPDAGEFRVRLAFAADVDLDLFVTAPDQETVYFANTPTEVGGELRGDIRCDDPAPRIETVSFAAAPEGRYRIGVDFPRRCDDGRSATAFVVYVETAGNRQSRRQTISLGRFLPIVLEVEMP